MTRSNKKIRNDTWKRKHFREKREHAVKIYVYDLTLYQWNKHNHAIWLAYSAKKNWLNFSRNKNSFRPELRREATNEWILAYKRSNNRENQNHPCRSRHPVLLWRKSGIPTPHIYERSLNCHTTSQSNKRSLNNQIKWTEERSPCFQDLQYCGRVSSLCATDC